MGSGFFINMSDEGEILGFGHGGADEGFMSQLYLELDSGNGYAIMTNGNNGTQLIGELEIRIKKALDVGYAKPEIKTLVDINKNKLQKYLGNYAVKNPVKIEVMLMASENRFLLTASRHMENEMHWYQGKGEFFALDGSKDTFYRDESGVITTLIISNGIRGKRKD